MDAPAPRRSTLDVNGDGTARAARRRSRAWPTCCATSSASPAPRSAATPATAAPARCCSTASQVCACLVAARPGRGPRVTTVEGLAQRRRARRALQRAFLAHGAAQCGICTPGMLMAAADLLARNAAPERGRGAWMRSAACCAAAPATARSSRRCSTPRPRRRRRRRAGRRHARSARASAGSTASAKVTGAERFGADAMPADALWLRVDPLAACRSARFDARRSRRRCVRQHPGLVARPHRRRRARHNGFGIFPDLKDQPVLADGARALSRRGGAGAGRRRAPRSMALRRRASCRSPGHRCRRCSAIDAATRRGRAAACRRQARQRADRRRRATAATSTRRSRSRARVARGRRSRPPSSSTPTSSPRPAVRGAVGDAASRVARRDADALHGPRRGRAHPGLAPGAGAHRADRLRRRLRRQARPLGAAAARGRGLEARPAGARCVYTRPESRWPSTTKRHPARDQRARSAATPRAGCVAVDVDGDFNTGAYASWGPTVANRVPIHATGPYACRNVRRADARRLHQRHRRPAPSAASACRRRRSRTRR